MALAVSAVDAALAELDGMRGREGDHLRVDLDARRTYVAELVERIAVAADEGRAAMEQRLSERVAQSALIAASATEQARSMACLACSKVDGAADAKERARAVSAAKIKIADACRHVSQESVQLHGGMGMTEELKISHTFRRLTMIAQQFGDADHHLARFASLG